MKRRLIFGAYRVGEALLGNKSVYSLHMEKRCIALLLFLFLSASNALADDAGSCDTHNWFQENNASWRASASLLCQGSLDASFERRKSALNILERVIRSNPRGTEAYQAHEVLLSFFFRAGQYREALKQADAMLALKPTAEDMVAERPFIFGLAANPDQSGKAKHSVLPKSGIDDGYPHIPVLANKKPALWSMDTGANISVMSDAEAAALGLVVHPVDTKTADISGTMTAFKISEVDTLTIGRTQLKHVAFMVLSHTQPPFDDIPTEQQALLGIQVLRALRSIRIDKTQQVEIAGPTDPTVPSSPMAFYQSQPVLPMTLQGKQLTFTLDTGAIHTTLNPPFAQAFPQVVASGKKTEHRLTGVGGSTTQDAMVIRELHFTLSGKLVNLSPVTVLLQKTSGLSEWAVGNLGYDLIRQTAPFTIDFRAMRLFAQ